MTTIFRNILQTRSFIAIDYMCEDALAASELSEADLQALRTIYESRNLDERYALAHEHLGEHEEAAKLRSWLAGAAERRQRNLLAAQSIL